MVIFIVVLVVLCILFFIFAQLKVSNLSAAGIAFSYFQIIAVFSGYNFKWPVALKSVLSYLNFINIDINLFVPECIVSVTYGNILLIVAMKYSAMLSVPWIFALFLFIAFCLELCRTLITRIYGPFLKRIFPWPWKVQPDRNFIIVALQKIKRYIANFLATPRSFYGLLDFADKCIHTFVNLIFINR
jgi:hypothetical protein